MKEAIQKKNFMKADSLTKNIDKLKVNMEEERGILLVRESAFLKLFFVLLPPSLLPVLSVLLQFLLVRAMLVRDSGVVLAQLGILWPY